MLKIVQPDPIQIIEPKKNNLTDEYKKVFLPNYYSNKANNSELL